VLGQEDRRQRLGGGVLDRGAVGGGEGVEQAPAGLGVEDVLERGGVVRLQNDQGGAAGGAVDDAGQVELRGGAVELVRGGRGVEAERCAGAGVQVTQGRGAGVVVQVAGAGQRGGEGRGQLGEAGAGRALVVVLPLPPVLADLGEAAGELLGQVVLAEQLLADDDGVEAADGAPLPWRGVG
jgi:hypothetical protein